MQTLPDNLEFYSSTYDEARQRFRATAEGVTRRLEQHAIPAPGCADNELTIDVAVIGNDNAEWCIVLSSGLHGAEGFLGSAVQMAWLVAARQNGLDLANGRIILVHGINPYGFKFLRRCNEDNIDLNRNFLSTDDAYQGAPDGYAELDAFLNPQAPPPRYDLCYLQMLWHILRAGLPVLKQSIAGGQYAYPKGLFFGGHGRAASTKVILNNITRWVAASPEVVHIDFHSALGRYGHYRLFLSDEVSPADLEWYQHAFDAQKLVPVAAAKASEYVASGLMGRLVGRQLTKCNYRYLCAEFGTYSVLRVLKALRAENRAHFYGDPASAVYLRAKQQLLECCCPADAAWRRSAVNQGLAIVNQAIASTKPA